MEDEEAQIVQATDAANEEDTVSAGELLQSMREAAGQEVECIASALKISPAQLRALEANNFGEDSELYFARALAARICRQLDCDPAEVLAKMPLDTASIISSSPARIPRRPQMQPTPIAKRSRMSLWVGMIVAVFVLAAAAIFALPWLQQRISNTPDATADATSDNPADAAANMAALSNAGVQAPQEGTLAISASGKTWIKISTPEPENKTIYEGQLAKGQTHTLTLTQYPVALVVGNSKNTKILHNEQAVDLSKSDKKGVARLELDFAPNPEAETEADTQSKTTTEAEAKKTNKP